MLLRWQHLSTTSTLHYSGLFFVVIQKKGKKGYADHKQNGSIPICGIAFFTIVFFMHVNSGNPASSIRSLDFVGNLIFIPSIISVLIGLVTGGVTYPWSSFRVIVPIVLGALGWICFHLHQHFLASNPSVPSRLFSNRTSAGGYILAFLSSILLQAAGYFLPVYFQAVLGTTGTSPFFVLFPRQLFGFRAALPRSDEEIIS